MKRNNNWMYIVITVLSSAVIIFLCLYLSYWNTSKTYKKQLENAYNKSFYEVVNNVNDLEINLSKLIATQDNDVQKDLLSDIYRTTTLSVNNLGQLPISYEKLVNINSLLNTMGGFSFSLLEKIYADTDISTQDYQQITELHSSVVEIQYDLNNYMANLQSDYSILDDVDFGNNNNFGGGLIDTESSTSKIPTLIYDGPFSDSVLNKPIVGLDGEMCSKEDAHNYLKNIFTDAKIEFLHESVGKFETYNFKVEKDNTLNVAVTKQGCFLLTITCFGVGEKSSMDIEQGVQVAEDFAEKVGINNMYSVWTQKTGNVLYVNLAPIVDKVIYYSDLIKVKVDMSTGNVVGWEAQNYATNHTNRVFSTQISLAEASKNISSELQIKERNYCIIPNKYVGETNAYEFICTWKNYKYYIYLDTVTGKEVNILRLVSTTNGDLLQ